MSNQSLSPEQPTEGFYAMKWQRDKLLWCLSRIADMAANDLRRYGPQPNSSISQIEADARATLDEVRGLLAKSRNQ